MTAPTASPRTARSADFRWKYTHRKTTEGGRRLPGTTSCPPTCQEAAVGIGYPAEEPWSRRGERKKERKKKRSVARQSRAALACKEPGTLFFFFSFSDGRGSDSSPYHFRPSPTGGEFYTGTWKSPHTNTTMSLLRYELYFITLRQGLFSTTEVVGGYKLQGIQCRG